MLNKSLEPVSRAAEEDEVGIRAIVNQMQQGWNLKKSNEYLKFFAEDVDYVPLEGTLLKGRNTITELLQKIFDTIYVNLDSNFIVEDIRYLRPDVAIVNVTTVSHFQNNPSALFTILMLFTATKNNGKWEVSSYQLTKKLG
ncbi:MAG: SgcJ/EcaC family oxidoreductase [Parachlamydiales bacterium]|jgi:uncharacterized protein (TIGR02246 family)